MSIEKHNAVPLTVAETEMAKARAKYAQATVIAFGQKYGKPTEVHLSFEAHDDPRSPLIVKVFMGQRVVTMHFPLENYEDFKVESNTDAYDEKIRYANRSQINKLFKEGVTNKDIEPLTDAENESALKRKKYVISVIKKISEVYGKPTSTHQFFEIKDDPRSPYVIEYMLGNRYIELRFPLENPEAFSVKSNEYSPSNIRSSIERGLNN